MAKTKRGRPEFHPSEDQRRMVTQAYAMGMRQDQICELIRSDDDKPLSPKTLRKHFKSEMAKGKSVIHFQVLSTALQIATDKDHPAVARMNIWTQQTQLGIKEISTHELTGADGEPLQESVPWVVIVNDKD